MRVTELLNQHIAVEKSQVIDPSAAPGNGEPRLDDRWTLVFTDRATGDQVRIGFGRGARDAVVRQLTGGIVLPDELPKA